MAHKTITLSIKEVCGVDTIVASPETLVLKNKNHKFIVENDIDVPAELRFFKADDKDGALYGEFCPDEAPGGVLKVGANEDTECKPSMGGGFAYTVEAPPYPPLDPIIIIEDFASFPGAFLFSLFPPAIVLPAIAVVGAVAGYAGCKVMMRRKVEKKAV